MAYCVAISVIDLDQTVIPTMPLHKECPIILTTFSNDTEYSLAALNTEAKAINRALARAKRSGACEVLDQRDATAHDLLQEIGDMGNAGRIAIFHYAGHADSDNLFFEPQTPSETDSALEASTLAEFVSTTKSIRCVFLNGCNTAKQAQGFLEAGVDVVICTTRSISDDKASTMAYWFYKTLANGEDLATSFARGAAAVKAGSTKPSFLQRALSNKPPVTDVTSADEESNFDWIIEYREKDETLGAWTLPKPSALGKVIRWSTHPLTAVLLIACLAFGIKAFLYSKSFLTEAGVIVKRWNGKPVPGIEVSLKQSSYKSDASEPSDPTGFIQFSLPFRTFRVGEKAELLTKTPDQIVLKPEGEFVLDAKGKLPDLLLATEGEIPTIAKQKPELVAGNYEYLFRHNSLYQKSDFEPPSDVQSPSSNDLVLRTAEELHTEPKIVREALRKTAEQLSENTAPEAQATRKLMLFDFDSAAKDYQSLAESSSKNAERSKYFELSGDAHFSEHEFALASDAYKQAKEAITLDKSSSALMELSLKYANAKRRSLNESILDAEDYDSLLNELNTLAEQALDAQHENVWIQTKLTAVQVRQDAMYIFGEKTLEKFANENAKALISLSNRIDPRFHSHWWALLKQTQASALTNAAKRGSKNSSENLKTALAFLNEAEKIWTKTTHSSQWANLQSHKGLIYKLLARFAESGELPRDYLSKSIEAHKLALDVITLEENPLGWGSSQCSLADALNQMASSDANNELEYRTQAIETYLAAINVLPDGSRRRIDATNNLANAYKDLGDRKTGKQALEQYRKSDAYYSAIYQYFDPDEHPIDWEINRQNHAVVLDAIAKLLKPSQGIPLFDRAIKIKRELANQADREKEPLAWARSRLNLASAITDRAMRQKLVKRHPDLTEAIQLLIETEDAYLEGKAKIDAIYTASQRGWTRLWFSRDLFETNQREKARAQVKAALDDIAACETDITIHSDKRSWLYLVGDKSLAETLSAVYGHEGANIEELVRHQERLSKAVQTCAPENFPDAWSSNHHILGRITLHIAQLTDSTEQREQYLDLSEDHFDKAETILSSDGRPLDNAILMFDRNRLEQFQNSKVATVTAQSSPETTLPPPPRIAQAKSASFTKPTPKSEFPVVNEWSAIANPQ